MDGYSLPRLALENLVKCYSETRVIDNVSLTIEPGTAHALLGENGAGKSTLLKMLSGVVRPTSGVVRVDGTELPSYTMAGARMAGVAMIHQELQQVPELTVAQNMFLGRALRYGPVLARTEMEIRAQEVLSRLDPSIDVCAPIHTLRVASRQLVEIARALLFEAKIIAMDEPTSSLMPTEVAKLEQVIADLCRQGVSVVYVSHKLDEVMRICHRGTVLRDGRHISEVSLRDMSERELVSMMVGRELSAFAHESFRTEEVVLTARDLCWGNKVRHVSLDLHKGEVLGIAGLVGAGRTELLQLLAGAEKPDSGEITVGGVARQFRTTRDAIALGIGLVPEERKRDGIIPLRSALSNTAITSLGRFTRLGHIKAKQMRARINSLYSDLQLRPMDPDKPIRLFSGGNQQKAILARWMLAETEILLLDEPTRGIDVGAKQEIYRLIRMLAAEGKAIIVVSSELLEIMTVSDRVLVMRTGHVAATLERDALSEETIAHYAAETLQTAQTELVS